MAEHVKMLATLLETKVNKMLPFQYISGKFRTFYTVASFSLLSSAYEITYPSGNFRTEKEKSVLPSMVNVLWPEFANTYVCIT